MWLHQLWEDNLDIIRFIFWGDFSVLQHVPANIVVLVSLWSETSHLLQASSWRLCNLLLIKKHEFLKSIISDITICESSHSISRSDFTLKMFQYDYIGHQQTYSLLKCHFLFKLGLENSIKMDASLKRKNYVECTKYKCVKSELIVK